MYGNVLKLLIRLSKTIRDLDNSLSVNLKYEFAVEVKTGHIKVFRPNHISFREISTTLLGRTQFLIILSIKSPSICSAPV